MVSNRRIGVRVFVGATRLTWKPVVNAGADDGPQLGLLMDLSVTGAGLFAPTFPRVRVDDLVVIGVDDGRAVVDVRRVSPTDTAGTVTGIVGVTPADWVEAVPSPAALPAVTS